METIKIYAKIAAAKSDVKKTKIKKEGKNDFSKYSYFTPEQVENIVFDACQKNKLLTMFNLIKDENGESGILTIIDVETGDKIDYKMVTIIPVIKATNGAQQLGGCVTYTERYLKMSAFGIVENSLDFDDKDTSKKPETKKPETKKTEKPDSSNDELVKALKELTNCVSKEQLQAVWTKYKQFQTQETFLWKKNNLKKQL